MKIPDGFAPIPFVEFETAYPNMVSEVAAILAAARGRKGVIPEKVITDLRSAILALSEGIEDRENRLLQFARALTGEPAVFMAQDEAFEKFETWIKETGDKGLSVTAKEVAEAVVSWFDTRGDFQAVTGRIVDDAHPLEASYARITVEQWLHDSTIDVGRIARGARLSRHVVADCAKRLEAAGYLRIQRKVARKPGDADVVRLVVPHATELSRSERAFADALATLYDTSSAGRLTLGNGPTPWPESTLMPPHIPRVHMIHTPTGPLAVVASVAKKLLDEHVISGSLNGELHAADAATVKAAVIAGEPVCDFCSSIGGIHAFDVPDFDMPDGIGRSEGGWAACDTCNELILANKRKQLLDRAITTLAFPKFSRNAIVELHAKFWNGMDDNAVAIGIARGMVDFVDGIYPSDLTPVITDRDKRIEAVARLSGLTRAEVLNAVKCRITPAMTVKLVAWRKRFGNKADVHTLLDLLDKPHKPLADIRPHWQIALDSKFAALRTLTTLLEHRAELKELRFDDDEKYLRSAQAYSFNVETTSAIREAANSIPHDSPLSSIETPSVGTGWFWFAEPFPVTASPMANDAVNALLWGWMNKPTGVYRLTITDSDISKAGGTLLQLEALSALVKNRRGRDNITSDELKELMKILHGLPIDFNRICVPETEPVMMFSAYVIDQKHEHDLPQSVPLPSTRWYWPLNKSFHDMIALASVEWDSSYGLNSKYGPTAERLGGELLMSKDATLKCIGDLSLFFVMACVWFRQTVPTTGKKIDPKLTSNDGHIERHAKKQLVREHKLHEPPTVRVVALRKSARAAVESDGAEREKRAIEYKCRFIVSGHARLQPCGPGNKDRKLIWIDAFIKGPDDKPLVTRDKVFAVIR